MPVIKELLKSEEDGSLSFGNYDLATKTKLADFEHAGDLYKVKTFNEITKLERNGLFVYESVPGTCVLNFKEDDKGGLDFLVSGSQDAQITLELEAEQEYEVFLNDALLGRMKTNLGGKLVFSAEFDNTDALVHVQIVRA